MDRTVYRRVGLHRRLFNRIGAHLADAGPALHELDARVAAALLRAGFRHVDIVAVLGRGVFAHPGIGGGVDSWRDGPGGGGRTIPPRIDRKSTRLNSSHL